jgi:TrmH family RNA methyltransferase
MTEIITSTANPLVKRFKRLHRPRGRSDEMATLIEGPTVFAEALTADVQVHSVLAEKGDEETTRLCDGTSVGVQVVTAEVLAAAGDTVHPQSPLAIISIPQPDRMHYRNTLVLRDIGDPGNVGTMIRSAAALGWDVCVTGESAHPWNPKVIRSGVGAHFRVHLSFSEDPIADARELGLDLVASVVEGGAEPVRGEHPMALFIGSEAHGLAAADIGLSDRLLTIPMSDSTDSLNAAVAASILMYTLGTS